MRIGPSLARYGAMGKARVASGSATAGELHHHLGHDPVCPAAPPKRLRRHASLRRRLPCSRSYVTLRESASQTESQKIQWGQISSREMWVTESFTGGVPNLVSRTRIEYHSRIAFGRGERRIFNNDRANAVTWVKDAAE